MLLSQRHSGVPIAMPLRALAVNKSYVIAMLTVALCRCCNEVSVQPWLRLLTCVPGLPGAYVLYACHITAACADGFYPLSRTRQTMTRASPAARLLCLTLAAKRGGTPMSLTHVLLLTPELASGPPARVLRPMLLVA